MESIAQPRAEQRRDREGPAALSARAHRCQAHDEEDIRWPRPRRRGRAVPRRAGRAPAPRGRCLRAPAPDDRPALLDGVAHRGHRQPRSGAGENALPARGSAHARAVGRWPSAPCSSCRSRSPPSRRRPSSARRSSRSGRASTSSRSTFRRTRSIPSRTTSCPPSSSSAPSSAWRSWASRKGRRSSQSLEVLEQALARANRFIVRLTPIGLFAIAAHFVGTVDVGQFARLRVYLIAYGAMAPPAHALRLPQRSSRA